MPPPTKKRTALWITLGILGVLLLCCLVFGGIGACVAMDNQKTTDALEAADSHYKSAEEALKPATEALGQIGTDASSSEVNESVAVATAQLETATDELKAAKGEIVKLDESSEVRKNYEIGISEAVKTVALLQEVLDNLTGASEFNDTLNAGVALNKKGKAKLEAAIQANNSRKHTTAGKHAASARALLNQSRVKFQAAHKMDPEAEVDQLNKYVSLQIKLATISQALAKNGGSGKVSAYNKYVKDYNDTRAEFNALPEPDILAGKYFEERMATLLEQIDDHGAKSDEYIDKAHDAAP